MLLKNKTGIVLGVANEFSIAWGCAQACKNNGAHIILSYLNDKMKKRVEPLSEKIGADLYELDVTKVGAIEQFFYEIKEKHPSIDFIIHSIAYANKDDLQGNFHDISKSGYLTALEISSYSLVEIAKYGSQLMEKGGSVVTMTYYGADKVIPSYNVMGVAKAALEANVRYLAWSLGEQEIRVNAISAGPINTLSARGISGFTSLLKHAEKRAPLKKNISIEDVGNTAVFLVSDMAAGITGDTIFVDAGMNILGF